MKRSWVFRTGVAVVSVLAGLTASSLVSPDAPFSVLTLAVVVAAWYGGYPIGLLATVLGVLGSPLFGLARQPITGDQWSGDLPDLLVFGFVGALTSAFIDMQRRIQETSEALRLQRQRFELVVRSTGIGQWYYDIPSRQLTADPQCRSHFGADRDAPLEWQSLVDRVLPGHQARVLTAARRAIDFGESLDMDFKVGGSHTRAERWVRAMGRVVRDEQGRPYRFDGVTVDVTRQKEAEEALTHANRMKDQFLATLSHELRTPLNAILGWAHMLRSGALAPSRAAHAAEVIERNARAQARLVEDLLDVSAIVTGQLRLSLEVVDVNAVVDDVLETIRPLAIAKGLQVDVRTAEPVRVGADADRLHQAVWNLLSNAVKFTPAGGRISVATAAVGGSVEVAVSDTGCGIDAGFLPYIFDRFSRAEQAQRAGIAGLGLGLAIVRHIVDAHGGVVVGESLGPGRGSRFTIRLPLRARDELPTAPADVATEAPSSSTTHPLTVSGRAATGGMSGPLV